MSWSNFEELKKFARQNENVKKKRPASSEGWYNQSARKRRRTNNESLCFVSNIESTSEIDGFSTDEENDEELLNCEMDSTSSNLSRPCVKRKYSSKWRIFSDKRNSSSEDAGYCSTYATQTGRKLQDDKSCVLMPDGAYELMQCSEAPKDDEIVWCASDDEELPGIVFCDRTESEDTDSVAKVLTKHPIKKSCRRKAFTKETSNNIKPSGEVISDFQSDHESSQESLSADISTPTPTPVSPVVVRTPKTASEWLKQVQEKSPQKSEQDQSPDGKGVCDSAKKKRKFLRSGLAEQLQHVISRDKSEKAFWNHRVTDTEKKQTSTSLQKEGSVVVQILSDQLQGSVHLTQCVLHSDDMNPDPQKTVFILFSCDTWKQLAMEVGAIVNIHPPWQKLDIAGCPWPVLLCTYFCEKQQTTADQSFDVLPHHVRAGLFIPFMHASPSSSSLVQSPRKGFKPSKLLFGHVEDESKEQQMISTSSLCTEAEDRSADRKPQTSILTAIESCGGFSGALVTFQCMVQRVYCKRAKLSKDKTTNYRCTLLNQDLKSVAKSSKKDANEEIRWVLLVQDIHGMCAEIQVPQTFQDSLDWHSCSVEGEGKMYTFSRVKVIQRTNRMRSAGLFSLIQSVCCSNGHDTVSGDNGSSQIVTQESQISSITSPPNFCYVLAVHESSRVSLCQGVHASCEGFLYKPCVFTILCDVHHADKDIEPQRISTSCKLLYYRLTGLSADSSFELFVTDSSLQNVPETEGRTQELLHYVKIVGKTCHVLPPELKEMQRNHGLILLAKHLLLKFRAPHELFADTYSVIRKAVPPSVTVTRSLFHEEYIQQDIFDSLRSLGPACLPSLSPHSRPGYIYLIEGVVTGVDEQTACCWLVCGTCETRDISRTLTSEASSQFFCLSCNHAVESPQTRTRLAVFVKVKSFPDAQVNLLLQQETIDKLLPVSYQDSDQGYDIEALLDKQLQPMICYVRECSKQQHGSMFTSSFTLEQIQIQY